MSDNNVDEKLEQFVEGREEIDFEEAKEQYNEKLEELQEKATGAIPEDQLADMAFTQYRAQFNKSQATPDQSSDQVDIISIGHGGIRNWSNGDTLLAYGVCNPSDEPANKAVFIIDEEDANLEEVKEMFTAFNALEGNFSVTPSSDLSDTYVCNSTSDTEVMESEIGMDTEETRQWVNENHVTDKADLASITEHFSQTNDQGYTAEFGADLKRLECTVVDFYIPNDWSFGVLTVQDASIVDPLDELDEDVLGDVDNSRSPGLTCWIDPEMITFGEMSVVDLYGTVERNDDGQINMNVCGVYPIMATEPDFSQIGGGSGGNDGDDTSAEEMSI